MRRDLRRQLVQIALQRDLAQQLLQRTCQGDLAHDLLQRSSQRELAESLPLHLFVILLAALFGFRLVSRCRGLLEIAALGLVVCMKWTLFWLLGTGLFLDKARGGTALFPSFRRRLRKAWGKGAGAETCICLGTVSKASAIERVLDWPAYPRT